MIRSHKRKRILAILIITDIDLVLAVKEKRKKWRVRGSDIRDLFADFMCERETKRACGMLFQCLCIIC